MKQTWKRGTFLSHLNVSGRRNALGYGSLRTGGERTEEELRGQRVRYRYLSPSRLTTRLTSLYPTETVSPSFTPIGVRQETIGEDGIVITFEENESRETRLT